MLHGRLRRWHRDWIRFHFLLSHLPVGSISGNSKSSNIWSEENRVLREQIGHRRMRFTDEQRRRLAARAKILST